MLVIGGSDSSGGAGIETISSIGIRTCLAVTALTVQTHEAVMEIHPSQPDLVADQMRAALHANKVAAIKIGMLATADIVVAVAGVLRENPQMPALLDPVLASTSGRPLLEAGAIAAMKRDLMPLCRLVTPNLIELALLVGSEPATDENGALLQGQELLSAGAQALLVKGGHASGPRFEPVRFDTPRLATSMRGTGCMLASATAAHLAKGRSLENSVRKGKLFVFEKLLKEELNYRRRFSNESEFKRFARTGRAAVFFFRDPLKSLQPKHDYSGSPVVFPNAIAR